MEDSRYTLLFKVHNFYQCHCQLKLVMIHQKIFRKIKTLQWLNSKSFHFPGSCCFAPFPFFKERSMCKYNT